MFACSVRRAGALLPYQRSSVAPSTFNAITCPSAVSKKMVVEEKNLIALQYCLAKLVRRSGKLQSSALDSHKKAKSEKLPRITRLPQHNERQRLHLNITNRIQKELPTQRRNDSDESGIRTHALSDRRGASLLLEGDLKTAP